MLVNILKVLKRFCSIGPQTKKSLKLIGNVVNSVAPLQTNLYMNVNKQSSVAERYVDSASSAGSNFKSRLIIELQAKLRISESFNWEKIKRDVAIVT